MFRVVGLRFRVPGLGFKVVSRKMQGEGCPSKDFGENSMLHFRQNPTQASNRKTSSLFALKCIPYKL